MDKVTVESLINAPVEKTWDAYTKPECITQWNHASDDWHCPKAQNDVRTGGAFSFRMEAKDGSAGFDFAGVYDEVVPLEKIAYTFGGRQAEIRFSAEGDGTLVRVTFDPESENPIEMQRGGWQAILDNFKKFTENN